MTSSVFGCGRVGIATWQLDLHSAQTARQAAVEIEQLGYRGLWIPELMWKEAFANAALLLCSTSDLVVATGVTSIYSRSAHVTQLGWKTLTEAFPDRYVLGVGVGHSAFVERYQGRTWEKPLASMTDYLDGLDSGRYAGAKAKVTPVRVMAALGPRMLELARARCAGAFTNCTPVEHTRAARASLGPDAFLAVSLVVACDEDPETARTLGRRYTGDFALANYRNNLLRLGWSEADIDGSSDALIDAVVAWGTPDAIARRVREHLDAGADHVCLNVQPREPTAIPLAEWSELATALTPELGG